MTLCVDGANKSGSSRPRLTAMCLYPEWSFWQAAEKRVSLPVSRFVFRCSTRSYERRNRDASSAVRPSLPSKSAVFSYSETARAPAWPKAERSEQSSLTSRAVHV